MSVAVKICGLTRAADVEAAIEAGADALGFVLDRGRVQLDLPSARELVEVARACRSSQRSVQTIAVLGPPDPQLLEAACRIGFDGIQVVASQAPLPSAPPAFVLPVFFDGPDLLERVETWAARGDMPAHAAGGGLQGLLNVDSAKGGGSGTKANWERAAVLARRHPIMLAGGLTPDNLARAIEQVRPLAVDVSSGVEATARTKDHAKLRAFVQAAKGTL